MCIHLNINWDYMAHIFSLFLYSAMENMWVGQSLMTTGRLFCVILALGQGHAVGCILQIPRHLLLRQWVWHSPTGSCLSFPSIDNCFIVAWTHKHLFACTYISPLAFYYLNLEFWYISKLINTCWRPVEVGWMPLRWKLHAGFAKDGPEASRHHNREIIA